MRFLLGIVFGALLTVLGVYALDSGEVGTEGRPMVNWEVVGERLDTLATEAKRVWNDFTREITGPP